MASSETQSELPLLVLLHLLKDQGAVRIEVSYSGSGDSGGIDDTTAYNANDDLVTLPDGAQALIEEWAWEHAIPHTGWENNEGGEGTVTIDLATFEVEAEHTDRYDGESERLNVEVPALPPEVVASLAELRTRTGITEFDVECYTEDDDDPITTQYADLPQNVEWDSSTVFEWLDAVLSDVEIGDDGGAARVTFDLETDPPTCEIHASSNVVQSDTTSHTYRLDGTEVDDE